KANLDVDDTSSYGPETTTIYNLGTGIYRYSVHDYTNGSSSNSSALANSGATVDVYKGSTSLGHYTVPANQNGTLWTVFEIRNGQIYPINTVNYASPFAAD
ncbi:MAG: hypothetical protein Q4F66_12720, partial [Clostridium sp.]|nr:hypothetical protein [Clostridium sp.]